MPATVSAALHGGITRMYHAVRARHGVLRAHPTPATPRAAPPGSRGRAAPGGYGDASSAQSVPAMRNGPNGT